MSCEDWAIIGYTYGLLVLAVVVVLNEYRRRLKKQVVFAYFWPITDIAMRRASCGMAVVGPRSFLFRH
jgi:hypothetical protein